MASNDRITGKLEGSALGHTSKGKGLTHGYRPKSASSQPPKSTTPPPKPPGGGGGGSK